MNTHPKTKKTNSVSTIDAPATAPATPVTSTNVPAPVTSATKLPPANANIPAPPQGFVPTNGKDYRGLLPRKTELAVLPDAVAELQAFTNFAATFGKTMPPLGVVLGVLDAAEQWSSMRAKASEWDLYCRTQEGLAWKDARDLLGTMRPAFTMATSVDATIAQQNPSIARLLVANATIAKRSAATRKAKRKAEGQGTTPAATAPAATKAAGPAPAVTTAEAAPSAAVTTGAAPEAAAPAPVATAPVAATGAVAPAAATANGAVNGAAH